MIGCKVTIKNSHIAGKVAMQLIGNAEVTIENSIIEGNPAMELIDSATVSVQGSTIRGAVDKVGAVKVKDLGENLWR